MATLNEKSSNKKYLNIIQGSLRSKANEGEGVQRVKKDGSTTFEKIYKDVTGHVTSIKIKDTDYGPQLSVAFDEEIIVNMGLDSKYASSFIASMGAIEYAHPVTLSVFDFEGKDKQGVERRFIGCSIKQNGVKVLQNRDVIPPLEEKKKAGKTTYDNTDRVNYFVEYVNNFKIVKDKDLAF